MALTAEQIIAQKGKSVKAESPEVQAILAKGKPVQASAPVAPQEDAPEPLDLKKVGGGLLMGGAQGALKNGIPGAAMGAVGGALNAVKNTSVGKKVGGVLKSVGDALTSSERGLGESISAGIFGNSNVLEKADAGVRAQSDKVLAQIKANRAAGKDTSRLLREYSKITNQPDITMADIVPAINKTTKQVLGEGAGVLTDIVTAGTPALFGKAAKVAKTAATVENATVKAAKEAGIVKKTLKGLGIGAAAGGAAGGAQAAARAAQENKSGSEIAIDAGIGAAGGAALGAPLGAVSGAAKRVAELKDPAREVERRAGKLREFFNDSITMKNTYTRMNAKGNGDVAHVLASDDAFIPTVNEGKINSDASIAALQEKVTPLAQLVRGVVASEGKAVPISELQNQAYREISHLKLRGDEYNRVKAAIDKDIAAYTASYAKNGNIALEAVDDIKKAKYGNINFANPDLYTADRAISRAARKTIERGVSDASVKNLNKELGKFYDAQEMLEKMNGRAVKNGKMGKHFIRTAGFIVGAPSGPVGSIVGGIAADQLADVMQSTYFKSSIGQKLVGEIKAARPSIFDEAEKLIAKRAADKANQLQLPMTTQTKAVAPTLFATEKGGISPSKQEAVDLSNVQSGKIIAPKAEVPPKALKKEKTGPARYRKGYDRYDPEATIDFGKAPKKKIDKTVPVINIKKLSPPDVSQVTGTKEKVTAPKKQKTTPTGEMMGPKLMPGTAGESKKSRKSTINNAGAAAAALAIPTSIMKDMNNQPSQTKKQKDLTYVRGADATPEDTALRLAKAISGHESGGKQVKGGSGEFGAFQFMPATWETISKQITGKVLPQTPENENKVAVAKITQLFKKYKGQGLSDTDAARNVALIWNTSLGGSEKPLIKKGVNGKGVKYDSGGYAEKVLALFAKGAGNLAGKKSAKDIVATAKKKKANS